MGTEKWTAASKLDVGSLALTSFDHRPDAFFFFIPFSPNPGCYLPSFIPVYLTHFSLCPTSEWIIKNLFYKRLNRASFFFFKCFVALCNFLFSFFFFPRLSIFLRTFFHASSSPFSFFRFWEIKYNQELFPVFIFFYRKIKFSVWLLSSSNSILLYLFLLKNMKTSHANLCCKCKVCTLISPNY